MNRTQTRQALFRKTRAKQFHLSTEQVASFFVRETKPLITGSEPVDNLLTRKGRATLSL